MALISKQRKETAKPVVLISSMLTRFGKWEGKTVGELDNTEPWIALDLSKKKQEDGSFIHNVVFEYDDMIVACPVSKTVSDEIEKLKTDPALLPSLTFYKRIKFNKEDGATDVAGRYSTYTGGEYMSLGLPGNIDLGERTSLADPVMVDVPANKA